MNRKMRVIVAAIFGVLAYWLVNSETGSAWFKLLLIVVIAILFENQAMMGRRISALEDQLDYEIERNSRREEEHA